MDKLDLEAIEARCNAATPGPWFSKRDGNQYIGTRYIPTAKCVGASRIEEIPRPWNPHQAIAFGIPAEKHEVSRFLDADGDFIAHAREDVRALIAEVRRLQSLPQAPAPAGEGEDCYGRPLSIQKAEGCKCFADGGLLMTADCHVHGEAEEPEAPQGTARSQEAGTGAPGVRECWVEFHNGKILGVWSYPTKNSVRMVEAGK